MIELFECKIMHARISRAQCRRNYENALRFDEREYLINQGHNAIWGFSGKKVLGNPALKKCKECRIGKENATKN